MNFEYIYDNKAIYIFMVLIQQTVPFIVPIVSGSNYSL